MTTATASVHGESVQRPTERPLERMRGRWGMILFVATEGMLFVFLFFTYFYLGSHHPEWPPGDDPSLRLALPMLGVLLVSSVVLWWGEKGIEKGSVGRLKAGLIGTELLGVVFLLLTYQEFMSHLRKAPPHVNAYESIFFTTTSLHLAHLVVGMLVLGHVLVRAFAGHFSQERHLAVKNASLYWHFVDTVWLLIIVILYISPRLYP